MSRFKNQILHLLKGIKYAGGDEIAYMVIECLEEDYKFVDVNDGANYADSVDDVTGVRVFDANGIQLGWFGIEPANSDGDIFDVVYDCSDNAMCNNVMELI